MSGSHNVVYLAEHSQGSLLLIGPGEESSCAFQMNDLTTTLFDIHVELVTFPGHNNSAPLCQSKLYVKHHEGHSHW